MTIVFDIDYEGLAHHIHYPDVEELRHLLHSDMDFLEKHLRSNRNFFRKISSHDSDRLTDGENLEIFLRDWRNKNDQSFSQLTKQLNTMNQEVKDLQDKVSTLEAKTDTTLGALAAIKDQNATLQQKIENLTLSDEDKASLKATSDSIDAEIAKVDAAIPPATDSGNATEQPA